MSKNSEFFFNALVSLLALVATAIFWTQPVLLTIMLFVVGIVHIWIVRVEHVVLFYITVAILGPLVEAFVMYFGAWSYAIPYVLGVPIWLPFLWGSAGLLILGIVRMMNVT